MNVQEARDISAYVDIKARQGAQHEADKYLAAFEANIKSKARKGEYQYTGVMDSGYHSEIVLEALAEWGFGVEITVIETGREEVIVKW